jgi:hypothetical protein
VSYLSELADSDPEIRAKLTDLKISNRALGRQLDVDEKNVRRWRKNNLESPYPPGVAEPKHKGGTAQWVAGMDLGTDEGEIRTVPRWTGEGLVEADEATLMREVGVNPEEWEIIARRESRWQQSEGGPWLRAYKLSVRRRGRRTGDLPVEVMNEILGDYQHHPFRDVPYGDGVFIVPVGDLQVGKIDGGGTEALIDRFAELTGKVEQRLASSGPVRRVVLPWLGDCIEGIVSQGGRLATRLDVSVTEQVRIYRRLMLHQIATLAPYAEHVIVPVVPGNHDETTRQFATTPTDSWAIEGASAVQDALALSGRYSHVSFLFPQHENLVASLNVGTDEHPFILAFAHGHQPGSPNKSLDWWKDQGWGRRHGGNGDLLLTGHFHHLRVEATGGGRTWVQIPALDGGSNWFRESKGADEPAGMISMWVTPHVGNGWSGLTVHS